MVAELDGAVCRLCYCSKSPLDHDIHRPVVVLRNGMERHQRIDHDHVDLAATDACFHMIDGGCAYCRAGLVYRGDREEAHRFSEQPPVKVRFRYAVALADGGQAAVEFVLILLAIEAPDAQRSS